jgi:hypothetical protein
MTARTARLTALAAAFTLTATALTGCAADDDKAGDTKVSVATPRDALLQAVPDAKVGAYRFVIKGGETPSSGRLDAPKKSFEINIVEKESGIQLSVDTLVIAKESWMKIKFKPANLPGLPKLPKKWAKLDPSKVKNTDEPLEYTDETDPGYAGLLVQNSSGLTETGPGKYAGTTDLTKSTEAEIVDDKTLSALGDQAKSVPFTAAVDGQGHLTSMIVKIPAAGKAKTATYSITYSGFGATPTPEEPAAAEQTPAPKAMYELLNS